MQLASLTLVLGGAASGKSAHAEALVRDSGRGRVYIATAQAHDAEMEAKIAAHRALRAGDGWRTVEAPRDPVPILAGLDAGDAALLDCATFWLSNAMLAGADWRLEARALIAAMRSSPAAVVVVSNELGQGVVPETALGRRFREAHGLLNQWIAAEAGLVLLVTAGLPLVLKGQGEAR